MEWPKQKKVDERGRLKVGQNISTTAHSQLVREDVRNADGRVDIFAG
jgi:hypothetical protein